MMIKVILRFEVWFEEGRGNIEKQKEEAKKLVEKDAKYYGWESVIMGIDPTMEVTND